MAQAVAVGPGRFPVSHWDSPPAVAIFPSREQAALAMTQGRPVSTQWNQASFRRRASAASSPFSTGTPRDWQIFRAAAGHLGVGVRGGDDHPAHPGRQDRLGAGRGAALVVAGLQGDVEVGSPGRLAGLAQGLYFGVGRPARR